MIEIALALMMSVEQSNGCDMTRITDHVWQTIDGEIVIVDGYGSGVRIGDTVDVLEPMDRDVLCIEAAANNDDGIICLELAWCAGFNTQWQDVSIRYAWLCGTVDELIDLEQCFLLNAPGPCQGTPLFALECTPPPDSIEPEDNEGCHMYEARLRYHSWGGASWSLFSPSPGWIDSMPNCRVFDFDDVPPCTQMTFGYDCSLWGCEGCPE